MKLPISQIKNLLASRGWNEDKKDSFSNRLIFFSNPRYLKRELVLPQTENAPDYEEAVSILLNKLATIEDVGLDKLIREAEKARENHLPNSNDDLFFRIITPTNDGEAIPLTLASTALSEAEILVLAGSSQAQTPKTYHRRIDNKISNSLLDRTFFNHTSHGSFVLTISCPVLAEGEQLQLGFESKDLSIARSAFLSIQLGLSALQSAINDNKHIEFAEDTLRSDNPEVSANLTQSIGNIVAADRGDGIEFGFNWSTIIDPPKNNTEIPFIFHHEDAKSLYEVAEKLRPLQAPLTNRFIGTVEALRGNLNDDGKRAGSIELNLLVQDVGWIRASAELDVDSYKMADAAHINGAQFVAINGTLEPRPRVWIFVAINSFEFIQSP